MAIEFGIVVAFAQRQPSEHVPPSSRDKAPPADFSLKVGPRPVAKNIGTNYGPYHKRLRVVGSAFGRWTRLLRTVPKAIDQLNIYEHLIDMDLWKDDCGSQKVQLVIRRSPTSQVGSDVT